MFYRLIINRSSYRNTGVSERLLLDKLALTFFGSTRSKGNVLDLLQ